MNDVNIFLQGLADLPVICQHWMVGVGLVAFLVIVGLYAAADSLSSELKPFREQQRLEEERQKQIAYELQVEEAAKRLLEDGYGKAKSIQLTDDGELLEEMR